MAPAYAWPVSEPPGDGRRPAGTCWGCKRERKLAFPESLLTRPACCAGENPLQGGQAWDQPYQATESGGERPFPSRRVSCFGFRGLGATCEI